MLTLPALIATQHCTHYDCSVRERLMQSPTPGELQRLREVPADDIAYPGRLWRRSSSDL